MQRDALLDSFGSKREALHQEAFRHREARDQFNDRTRRNAQRRDELNAQVRGIVERANAHRAKRDEKNALVREAKAERDRLNREGQEKAAKLQESRRARGPGPAVPLAKLKAELRHLEFQHQTTALAPQKEKALIELIAAKTKEIKAREATVEEDPQAKGAWDDLRATKEKAEEQHARLTQAALEAQGEHDAMAALFAEADRLRKEADAAQAEFVKTKVESDRLHRLYMDCVLAIKDLDRVAHALRGDGDGRPQQAAASAEVRAEAEEIFDKFRKGEKLSTEDLMALQKAGRL
jgi:uncharacterized coiled-coil DUF342 family protein